MSETTTPNDDEVPTAQLIAIADTAYEQSLTTGDVRATNEAIESYRFLFEEFENDLTGPELGQVQGIRIAGKLSTVLIQRFEHLGNIDDMNQAVEVQTKAVALALSDPSNQTLQMESMIGLGRVLSSQFDRTGDAVDAELAVEYFGKALEHLPENSIARSVVLGDFAQAHLIRYQHFDDEDDLNTALDNYQGAINAIPLHLPERAPLANVYGKALLARFELSQNHDDLESAIMHLSEAANQTSATNPDRPKRLNHFGDALLARFQVLGNETDLQEAINIQTQALEFLEPKNVTLSVVSGSLASGYYARFKHLEYDILDLDRAIEYFKTAAELTLFSNPAYAHVADQLAMAFVSKYQVTPDVETLNYAIMLHEQAVTLTPGNSRYHLRRVMHLGHAYIIQYQSTQLADDRISAIDTFTEALDIIGGNVNHQEYNFIVSELDRIGHTIP